MYYNIIFMYVVCVQSRLSLETHFFTNFVQDGGPPMKHLQNGVQGFGNGPFLKVAEGKKRFNDIVKKYGHSHNKDILINELLGLLKWDKLYEKLKINKYGRSQN